LSDYLVSPWGEADWLQDTYTLARSFSAEVWLQDTLAPSYIAEVLGQFVANAKVPIWTLMT